MEICEAPTTRLKALNKQHIEMENTIRNLTKANT